MSPNKIHILAEVNSLLRTRFSDNLKDVILFGSRLSENFKDESDYDILVILKKKVDWKKEREISDILYDIELKYNIVTDTHIICEAELETPRGKQPIFLNAIEKGIHA